LIKRLAPRFPAVVVLILLAALVSKYIDFEATGGSVVGALPEGLPSLYVPTWLSLGAFTQLLLPVLAITLISFIETASSAKVESQQGGQKGGKSWNQNQDLIGQGLAKIASGLSGAFPTSSSFSRSALNLYAGAKTPWANIVSVGVAMLALLFFLPILHHVPQSVLAAIVVAAIYNLIAPKQVMQVWRISKMEAFSALATFVVTILSAPNLYWGIITGLLMGLGYFLYQRLHPRIIEVGLHSDGSLRDRHLWKLPALGHHMYALRMDAELDFASSSDFERAIIQHLAAHPDTQHVCLFAQPINSIDATGVATFGQIRRTLQSRDITLHISGIKLPVERVLIAAKELPAKDEEWPLLRMYRTDAEAVAAFKRQDDALKDSSAYI
jgi:sulfate permease, SulP family